MLSGSLIPRRMPRLVGSFTSSVEDSARRRRIGGRRRVERAVERGAVRREDAAAHVLRVLNAAAEGEGRVGIVLLRHDRERGGIVHGEAGHEARPVRRHRKHRRLRPQIVRLRSTTPRGHFVHEDVSAGVGRGDHADDEIAVRRAQQLAGERSWWAGPSVVAGSGAGAWAAPARSRRAVSWVTGSKTAACSAELPGDHAGPQPWRPARGRRCPLRHPAASKAASGCTPVRFVDEIDDISRRAEHCAVVTAARHVEEVAVHGNGAGQRTSAQRNRADHLLRVVVEDLTWLVVLLTR